MPSGEKIAWIAAPIISEFRYLRLPLPYVSHEQRRLCSSRLRLGSSLLTLFHKRNFDYKLLIIYTIHIT
jgi:hypothetical protein